MALETAAFKSGLKTLLDGLFYNTGVTPEQARTTFSNGLGDLLVTLIKSGTPVVPGTGLTAPGGGGAVTGTSNSGSIT
jgi:hypothetical protein